MADIDVTKYGEGGQLFLTRCLEAYEFTPADLAMLETAAELIDRRDELAAIIADQGLMTAAYGGRLHPAQPEHRQVSLALARVLAALDLPGDD